jgi:hypothetical protein
MASEHQDDMTPHLRTAMLGLVAAPSGDVRRRAWETFERALDRHLAAKRGRARPAPMRR